MNAEFADASQMAQKGNVVINPSFNLSTPQPFNP